MLCFYFIYMCVYVYIYIVIYETPVFKNNQIRKQITQFVNKQQIWVDTSPKHIYE